MTLGVYGVAASDAGRVVSNPVDSPDVGALYQEHAELEIAIHFCPKFFKNPFFNDKIGSK